MSIMLGGLALKYKLWAFVGGAARLRVQEILQGRHCIHLLDATRMLFIRQRLRRLSGRIEREHEY